MSEKQMLREGNQEKFYSNRDEYIDKYDEYMIKGTKCFTIASAVVFGSGAAINSLAKTYAGSDMDPDLLNLLYDVAFKYKSDGGFFFFVRFCRLCWFLVS